MNISIYRALTGKRLQGNRDIFNGVTENELKDRGILFSNYSSAQTSGEARRRSSLYHPEYRKVTGLPVFLDESSVIWWASSRRYVPGREPAIAVVNIPVTMLDEGIKIIKNTLNESGQGDTVITSANFTNPEGNILWKGEFYLQGDLEQLRKYETFLRPSIVIDGEIKKGVNNWLKLDNLQENEHLRL